MRNRFLVILGVVAVLAFYTGAKAADIFPAHRIAAMAASVLLVAFFVAWQIAYRNGAFSEESGWTRALAWTASVGMGVWATFLLVSMGASLAGLLLSVSSRGAVLARALPAFAGGASVMIAGLGLRGAVKGPRVKNVAVAVPGLHEDLRGLRIVQISDLHVGPTIRRRDVERVVERALALEPDLIAITGDLTDGTVERLARHVAPLARLRAPLGVYYVTGNHEYYWGADAWIEKAKELGFVPLLNENRVISRVGARLLVGGIPDESGGAFVAGHRPDVRRAAAADGAVDFRLLLAHRPDGVPAAARAGFDLQLSGHTHGGQFFPASLFIGLFHRYTRGLDRHGRMQVYVSPGTGYWGPAHRFAVPSEITLLTLNDEEKNHEGGMAAGEESRSQNQRTDTQGKTDGRWLCHKRKICPGRRIRQSPMTCKVEQNMEVKGATFLFTLAGLMITFAGFSALLLGLRQAAGARLSLLDRSLARTVMTYIFVLTAAALLPALLALYDIQETLIWRVSGVLFALPMLSLQVTYPSRRRKVVGKGPPPAIYAVFVVLGSAATLAMLACILIGVRYSAAVYITALTIDFFTVAFAFVTALDVIMLQSVEMSEPPSPH